jgi:ApbE superfamily uncharacterized protein (UPF0280 family)
VLAKNDIDGCAGGDRVSCGIAAVDAVTLGATAGKLAGIKPLAAGAGAGPQLLERNLDSVNKAVEFGYDVAGHYGASTVNGIYRTAETDEAGKLTAVLSEAYDLADR